MRALLLALLLTACADDDTLPVCVELCPDATVYFCTDATGAMCSCVPDPIDNPDHYERCTAQAPEGSDQ